MKNGQAMLLEEFHNTIGKACYLPHVDSKWAMFKACIIYRYSVASQHEVVISVNFSIIAM